MSATFSIVPYEGALPLRFGMSQAEIESILGVPSLKTKNRKATTCFNYPTLAVGFGGLNQTADHFGFSRGSNVKFKEIEFFSNKAAWQGVFSLRPTVYECLGFLVFLDLGFALSGFHDGDEDQLAVVVFAKGGYDRVQKHFKPWKEESEQSGADNPRPCGTFGMAPADSASRAGAMPKASGGI